MMMFWKRLLCAVLAALMVLCGVPSLAEAAATEAETLAVEGAKIYTHDGRVTFVEGACTTEPVLNQADAEKVVDAMIPQLGGDERTNFEFWRALNDTNGNVYYVFRQMYANVTVSGGAVKVVTDAEGNMLGLISSVESELPDTEAAEGIADADAEAIVVARVRETRELDLEPLEGRTEKVVLPVNLELDPDFEEEKEESRFVWAVYTENPTGTVGGGSDLPYLAHYVTMDGEYLYNLPTIMPGDEAGAVGFNAAYVFEFMEPAEYTGMVTWSDGSEHEITVELMRDSRTGMYYMGNIKRRIAVADCWEVLYNKGHVVLEASKDNTGWDTATLISMYNYCRAWDYYDAIGWHGADGMGTPILVLKDFCYKDHTPVNNAAYAGKYYGWQMFLSSSGNDLWQCLDVLAHEFTHCVTGSVMTYNAYKNDFGAINEAMSDIQGNICEMLNNDTEDTTWELGEHSSTPVRNMSDPHKYSQPEYTWDLYYKPHVKEPTEINDRGGVHSNSSLLNRLAYLLCAEGGMTLEDARAFWFAVDCAMVPGTDHAQLSELMPWVMKLLGMDNYLEALDAAIDAVKLRSDDMPESFGPNRALVELTLPDQEQFTDGNWGMVVLSVDLEGLVQRIEDIAMGNGEYATALDELNALMAKAKAQIEKKKEPGLLDQLLDAMFPSKEAEPEPEPEPKPEAPEEETGKKLDVSWLKRYFGDVVFFDSGAAGQDGRTVRMVSKTGDTIPVLYNMKMKESESKPLSMALAVYTMGRWYDLGGFIQQATGYRLDKTSGEKIGQDFMGDLFEKLLPAFRDPAQLRELLLTQIREDEVCVVSAEGLENVTILEGEIIDAIFDTITDPLTEEQSAA